MANKREKKLSGIICICVVVHNEQCKQASKSYQKILDKFEKAMIDCRDTLPEYTAKEAKQIKNSIIYFSKRAFLMDSEYHSNIYTSMLLAIIEHELPHMTAERAECFMLLHSIINQMHRYWDRKLNSTKHYTVAADMVKTWELCCA